MSDDVDFVDSIERDRQ